MTKTLEGIVVAASHKWTLQSLVEQFRALCDRVSVYVDLDSGEAAEIVKLIGGDKNGAKEIAITGIHVGGYIEQVLPEVYRNVSCDWAVRLDDDEMLSEQLADRLVDLRQGLLDGDMADFYRTPRAHVTDWLANEYVKTGRIDGGPNADWWPNIQLRVFKRGHVVHRGKVHEGPEGIGVGGVLHAPILHFNLCKPREDRVALSQRYRVIGGEGETRGDTALYEDYDVEVKANPYGVWKP